MPTFKTPIRQEISAGILFSDHTRLVTAIEPITRFRLTHQPSPVHVRQRYGPHAPNVCDEDVLTDRVPYDDQRYHSGIGIDCRGSCSGMHKLRDRSVFGYNKLPKVQFRTIDHDQITADKAQGCATLIKRHLLRINKRTSVDNGL